MEKYTKIDIIAWINNEEFDGVSLGDPKQSVVDQLGVPSSWGGGGIDFIAANVWNYGTWTLFFEGGTLDAIRCGVRGLPSDQSYFDVELHEPFLSGNIDKMEKDLTQYNIPCIRFPGVGFKDSFFFTAKNVLTGDLIECKRGPKVPMLVTGEKLRTVILFNKRGDKAVCISSPFCWKTQEFGYKKLDQKGSYTLV